VNWNRILNLVEESLNTRHQKLQGRRESFDNLYIPLVYIIKQNKTSFIPPFCLTPLVNLKHQTNKNFIHSAFLKQKWLINST
jgi:hypothetical protein